MTKNDTILISLVSPWGAPGPVAVQMDPLGVKFAPKMGPKSGLFSYESNTNSILFELFRHF